MGTKLQARILHSLAQRDCFDGVGRIFLLEARQALRRPELTSSDITDLWQEYYSGETAEEKQFNLVLIYFDGKETVRSIRQSYYAPVYEEPIRASGEEFQASKPEVFENTDFKAENPEDRIIL
jgi:hypothetical protein